MNSIVKSRGGSFNRTQSGFTLIELLVVISIIGLLSSVVLASVQVARNKAKDAAIQQAAVQFRNLYAIEYANNNSYKGVRKDQTSATVSGSPLTDKISCLASGNGSYYYCTIIESSGCTSYYLPNSQAEKICKNVFQNGNNNGSNLIIGTKSATDNFNNTYALFLSYPSDPVNNGRCVGYSGVSNKADFNSCFTDANILQ